MKTEVLKADHPIALSHALDVLKNGGLVVFPTDTVYGLASLAFKKEFIEGLFVAKGRNASRAIAVLLASIADLNRVATSLTRVALALAEHFWPGPLTLVVTKHSRLPSILSPYNTIGVRVPDHPVALALLKLAGPLAVTSANLSGKDNTTTAQEVLSQLDGKVHLVLDGGQTPGGIPSTVVDCTHDEPLILRPGPITLEEIRAVL